MFVRNLGGGSNAGLYGGDRRALAPLARQSERIGGSRAARPDRVKAYLNADRLEEARQLLVTRRPGASGVPVAGAAALR
jgi:hypothetical protein